KKAGGNAEFPAMQKLATIHVSIRGIFRKEKEDMMQSRLWISAVVLLSSVSVQTAAASPQEDVAAAGQKWATVFAENSPDAMLPLYAKDGAVGHAFSNCTVGPCRAESLLRGCLPGLAEGHR